MSIPALLLIETIAQQREEVRARPERLAALERLQRWQVDRLRRTYEDYHAQARYKDALDFFMQDLYGPHDFRERDRDMRKVLQTWYRLLPERAMEAVSRALELEALSQALDLDVADALGSQLITQSTYAQAYRTANRRHDRQRQIWLIMSAGRSLDELIHHKWIAAALRLARRPARVAGVLSLHAFLERGYAAFAKMRDAEDLLRIIEQRETAIMRNLFDGNPQPFDVVASHAPVRRRAR